MRKETKIVKTSPEKEQSTITTWEAFGWEVLSSQELLVKESHSKSNPNGGVSEVVTTTNYVKLAFNRDVNIKNKEKLNKLQDEYNSLRMPIKPTQPGVGGIIFAIVAISLILIVLFGVLCATVHIGFIAFLLIALIVGVSVASVTLINHVIKSKPDITKDLINYDKLVKDCVVKRKQILEQARAIVKENDQIQE